MEQDVLTSTDDNEWLLNTVKKFAISPEDVKCVVRKLQSQYKKKNPNVSQSQVQDAVAAMIVSKYTWFCTVSGGTTALTGVIPGIGTAVAAIGGGASDAVVCMKLQVDMCMCLAENYGYDITTPDAQNLSLLISGGATISKFGGKEATRIASQAGVKLIKKYLTGATLQTIKEMFKKIGITFTRKALEKALPFGIGVVIGAGTNFAFTKYVGYQANKWFIIDRDERTD